MELRSIGHACNVQRTRRRRRSWRRRTRARRCHGAPVEYACACGCNRLATQASRAQSQARAHECAPRQEPVEHSYAARLVDTFVLSRISRTLCLVRQALARQETRVFTRQPWRPLTTESGVSVRDFECLPRKCTVRDEGYSHASNGSLHLASGISCHDTKIVLTRNWMRVADCHALRAGRERSPVCRSRRVCRSTAEHAAHRRGLLRLSRGATDSQWDRAAPRLWSAP